MGFNIDDLKESKYLTKNDVAKPILVTIRGWDHVNVETSGNAPKMKYVLHFNEVAKPMVLNSTNGQVIASITGSKDSDGWVGKKIVLYNDPNISFGGALTGGIRVRAPRNVAPPVQAPAPAPPPLTVEAIEPDPEGDPDVPF